MHALQGDVQLLLDFKASLPGNSVFDSWDPAVEGAPCNWEGISCRTGRVSRM